MLASSTYRNWFAALAAACDRLVHPSLTDGALRAEHARFIGSVLAAPFLLSGAGAFLLPPQVGGADTLIALCMLFGAFWSTALVAASTARLEIAGALALVTASLAGAGLVALAGGLASPAALVLLALPLESFLSAERRRAAIAGGVAALAALPLQYAVAGLWLTHPAEPAAWHWILPLAYAALAVPRVAALVERQPSEDRGEAQIERLDRLNVALIGLGEGGEVVSASAGSEAALGLPQGLMMGSGLSERVHIADRVAFLCAVSDLRAGGPARSLEVRLRLPQKAGEPAAEVYRLFGLDMAPPAEDGSVPALVRPLRELEEMRGELARARDRAGGVEIAKSRFLAAVSHELRTPLNAIIGFSDMLLHEMFGAFADPRQKEYVGLVCESGHHLLAVVNSILDVSRIESGAYATYPEPFRFREAVKMCRSMLRLHAEAKNIGVSENIAPEIGEIVADRRAVQQMLINLVSNAIKFTPNGGSVSIGARRVGSRLHFWVSDTGIGIAESDLARLGTPFTQVQNDYTRQFEGTGLGLALVKGLVALHEGTMAIESAPGEGTTVTISLPADGPGKRRSEGGDLISIPVAGTKERDYGTLRKTA